MAKFANGLPVNELGEVVVTSGVGSSNIVGTLPPDLIPVDNTTGGIKLNKVALLETDAGGRNRIDGIYSGDDRAVLVIGGDHPYAQWYNNRKGIGKAYRDRGIKPYLAVCWDQSADKTSGNGATFRDFSGSPQMMTLAQALELQADGIEFVSHATRHVHFWDQVNTGIHVKYLGAAGAPTVLISTTGITLTGSGGAENATLTWASYPTLSQLQAAIGAMTNWVCYLADELDGTEASSLLIPIKAARNVADPGSSDETKSVQRFALSGGIVIDYKGTGYANVTVHLGSDNILRVYCDGVRLISIDLTVTDTFSALVTAINGYAISGLTARLVNNGYDEQATKFRETYCWGDELCTSLRQQQYQTTGMRSVYLQAGVNIQYVVRKLLKTCKSRAAANGIKLKNFAQPGGKFQPYLRRCSLDVHDVFRAEFSALNADSPKAMPSVDVNYVTTQQTFNTGYDADDTRAAIRALADSGPWYVDVLIHCIIPDGSSPYDMSIIYAGDADQTEANFIALLDEIKAQRDAGKLLVLAPDEAKIARQMSAKPKNRVFNPSFINSGKTLLGVSTAAAGSNGRIIPGWRFAFATSNFSAASISDGRLSMTTNGALGTTLYPVQQCVYLERGKTYDIGMLLDLTGIANTKSVKITLFPNFGRMAGDYRDGVAGIIQSVNYFGGAIHDAVLTYTVPQTGRGTPARIVSKAGNFNLSAGAAISINYDSIGAVTVVIAGATPSATKAEEIAAAINAAIKADAAYTNRQEWWNIASAENGKVIIEAPYQNVAPSAQYITISNGSGNPMLTVWGGTDIRAVSTHHEIIDSSYLNYMLTIELASTTSGTVAIEAPYISEVKYGA